MFIKKTAFKYVDMIGVDWFNHFLMIFRPKSNVNTMQLINQLIKLI